MDSESSKYPKRTEAEKPAPPKEPDPRQHECPWLDYVFDDEELASDVSNRDEYMAYNLLVLHARKFTPEQMAKHTRKELTWRVLFGKEREKYRGEIARVEGRLKSLIWIGSNKSLESQGVKSLYEAWIFGEHYNSNPTCVIISELPPGVKPDEDIRDIKVICDGYFFKRYKYWAKDGTRLAPLVIGRTLTVQPPGKESTDPGVEAFGRMFLPLFLTMLLGMVTTAFLLHRWFRHGDERIRQTLLHARANDDFIAPTEPPEPSAQRGFPEEPSRN